MCCMYVSRFTLPPWKIHTYTFYFLSQVGYQSVSGISHFLHLALFSNMFPSLSSTMFGKLFSQRISSTLSSHLFRGLPTDQRPSGLKFHLLAILSSFILSICPSYLNCPSSIFFINGATSNCSLMV